MKPSWIKKGKRASGKNGTYWKKLFTPLFNLWRCGYGDRFVSIIQ